MNLKEAFEKAKDGDTLNDSYSHTGFLMDRDNDMPISLRASMSDGWQIIPAGPKVLTFREWYFGFDEKKNSRTKQDIEEGFNAGDENGQLKEWLNHKELRESVEEFSNFEPEFLCPSIVCEYQGRLKTLLYKLKEAK